MSVRSPTSFVQQGYSRQGFSPLPDLEPNMPSTATGKRPSIEENGIPLESVVTHNPSDPYHPQPTSKDGLNGNGSETTFVEKNIGMAEKNGLFHRHRGKRRVLKRRSEGKDLRSGNGDDVPALTRMGRIYQRILHFSLITRYFIYVFPLGGALAVPIVIGATSARKARIGGVSIVWLFTWLEIGELNSLYFVL